MVWIPGERDRPMREWLAHRGRVVRTRTAVINERHALSSKRNLEVPWSLWHRQAPEPWQPEALGGYGPRMVHETVALLRALHEQIRGLDQALQAVAQEDPEARRLMTHPGVGPVTAVAVRAWVGDIHRVASARHLMSDCGLAPRVRQSADTERHGHISTEGTRPGARPAGPSHTQRDAAHWRPSAPPVPRRGEAPGETDRPPCRDGHTAGRALSDDEAGTDL